MSRVLIIEDEVEIADLEKDYLELSGFEVEIENDGTVGLKRALTEDFDMYILDLMLPGIDGFEICKQIREEKNTPILMVSAKKDDIDKIRGLGLGADDYITKPFSPSELVARVKAHLARYERLIGSNTPRMIRSRSVESASIRRRDVSGSTARRSSSRQRSLTSDISCGESESCIYEGRTVPPDLGYGIHRGHCDGDGTHQKDPRKDRDEHQQTAVHRNNLGSRVQI